MRCCVEIFYTESKSLYQDFPAIVLSASAAQASIIGLYYSDSAGTVNRDTPGGGNFQNLAGGLSRVNDVEIDQGAGASLLPHNDGEGRSIVLDTNKNLLFFSAFDFQSPGTGGEMWSWDSINLPMLIFSNVNTGFPDIEIDPITMRLYATDYANGQIISMDYSGLNVQTELANLNNPFGLALQTVPEPGTLAPLGLGLAGLGFARRRRSA